MKHLCMIFSRRLDHLFRWVQLAPGGTLFFRLSIALQHDADVQRWGRNLLFSKNRGRFARHWKRLPAFGALSFRKRHFLNAGMNPHRESLPSFYG